jgi:hypothetical protein
MPLFSQPSTAERRSSRQSVGAITWSCTGLVGSTVVAATHGSALIATLIFVTAQAWTAVDLTCRWRLRLRFNRLQEDIARAALSQPENEDIRTLLIDVASTHLDDLGNRLPARPQLGRASRGNSLPPPAEGRRR